MFLDVVDQVHVYFRLVLPCYVLLAYLFNKVLAHLLFPKNGRSKNIIQYPRRVIFLKSQLPSNLLALCTKVLDRIIHDKIISFICPILLAQQFGFLMNRSSRTHTQSFFSIIFEAINCGNICDALYIDLRKAFDAVKHSKPLFKYRNMDYYIAPFGNYLKVSYRSNRYHFVSIDGGSYEYLKILSGVTQGVTLVHCYL